jgi:formylglycine-generating enzyme required for sulfatase activity
VELTRPFYLGVFAVTQGQWLGVMGDNPSYFCATGEGKEAVAGMDTGDFPVEMVSWDDAQTFLEKLGARPDEKEKGWHYRLPSEAEWEYACRGGASSSTPFCFGRSLASAQANFNGAWPYGGAGEGPSLGRTCPAGSYRPNAWGLFDLHGNVWEWCSDRYAEDYYGNSSAQDPPGPSNGSRRVIRGGSWGSGGRYCRAANRNGSAPSRRYSILGFRVGAVPRDQVQGGPAAEASARPEGAQWRRDTPARPRRPRRS